ncbi:hypothetical protein [Candidatus Tokpelaia sp.]|uniref:hypothetical protein n=1 Tax=Candidatus Tokpelaia sp. TaxID=2233777 RepID=UPI0012394793|nr:hypothetical protein [Candidatus Tokpelaia sp.]
MNLYPAWYRKIIKMQKLQPSPQNSATEDLTLPMFAKCLPPQTLLYFRVFGKSFFIFCDKVYRFFSFIGSNQADFTAKTAKKAGNKTKYSAGSKKQKGGKSQKQQEPKAEKKQGNGS